MPASDILNLRVSMAERAIRLLYAIALVLIALAVIFGLWRGATIMSHPLMTPPAISAGANPQAAAPQVPQPRMGAMRPSPHGFYGRFRGRYFFMVPRHSVGAGVFIIIATLVRGLVAILAVRVLAEIGLAILQMPRRP